MCIPGPSKGVKFQPPVCFWWLRGSNFRPLEDSGIYIIYIYILYLYIVRMDVQSKLVIYIHMKSRMLIVARLLSDIPLEH